MSFVLDQVQRIDAQLDRLQLATLPAAAAQSPTLTRAQTDFPTDSQPSLPPKRIAALQTAIRGLTPGSSESRFLLKPWLIQTALSALSDRPEATISVGGEDAEAPAGDELETELEWLLVSKATTQVYGHVLSSILDEAVRLSDDIWYWDEVLGSQQYTALYSIQTSPLRLWAWTSNVWEDVKARGGNFSVRGASQDASDTLTERWKQFYGLVRQVVKEKSVREVHKQMLSPVTRIKGEVRQKQAALKKVRVRNANALGVLLGEGLANESGHGEGVSSPVTQDVQHKWRASVARNVALMEAVLVKINDLDTPVDKFDSSIAALTDDDPLYAVEWNEVALAPQSVAERLSRVITLGLSQYSDSTRALVKQHGKPPRLVRYWLPIASGVIFSSTILRVLVNRKAEVVQWIQDLGATVVDFWQNWVVEPTRNVIRTIRHDQGSEISIMSKRSLEGDRESLERMVVDFAVDNPGNATESGSSLTETEIADIRAKVREGDLTPVLKAYEKDLISPLKGAVRGNLIRALLIQVQKTKVDVEVAMGGIDSLLKSQELLIGFISLTPGLLVAYGVMHYVRSSLSEKRGSSAARKQGKMLRQLRNVDRILTSSQSTEYGELLYKDQGLLLCEVHVLRQFAQKAMPTEIYREFSDEAEELSDVRMGIERQRKVAARIRWAYGRWLT
ncbi:Nuclear control of ATPase protein 2 [Pseudocercospora fuligena]|uniref:Nuclear control of ATPase protein 2 n=1 Tax=Pseudocercospora fuligena TaxID=685502 RepID=A0A8H6RGE2_9PEZI|nr:Nuclear control of ATPase protein 2 [Pseudocercospora fuligena]